MKKTLLSILFLGLIAVVAVTPYLFGMEAERIFEQQMTQLNSSRKISVADRRFRRGWFSSVAETTFAVRQRGIKAVAEHSIEHGPFPISDPLKYLFSLKPLQALIVSTLVLPDISASGEDISVGTLTTVINIDSTTDTSIDIPASNAQLADAATVAWDRIGGTVSFEPDRASWQGALDIGDIDWAQSESSVSLGHSKLKFLTFPGQTGLAMGQSSLVAESLKVRIPDSEHLFEFSSLELDSTATEQEQNVEYGLAGGFASALLPEMELSGARWHFSAHDLDRDTLTELNNMSVDSAVPLNKLLSLVSKRSAGLDSGMTLQTDSGPLAATVRIRLAGKAGTSNPLALIGALDGEMALDMPAAVTEMAARAAVERELSDPGSGGGDPPATGADESQFMANAVSARIQAWVDANLLTREGDRYRLHASVKDGSVSLNGEPVNILSLLR